MNHRDTEDTEKTSTEGVGGLRLLVFSVSSVSSVVHFFRTLQAASGWLFTVDALPFMT
jgi:hypothetical protein